MANLVERSGRVNIRVGGNTQETAVMVQNTTNGQLLEKDYTNTLGTVSLRFGCCPLLINQLDEIASYRL